MKILNREQFLAMPEGTMFCKGTPWAFGSMSIKHETTSYGDFYFRTFEGIEFHDSGQLFDRYQAMLDDGASYPLETSVGRDGLDEADALFLVFETDDLLELRQTVDWAIDVARGRKASFGRAAE